MTQQTEGFPQRLSKLRGRRGISAAVLGELCGLGRHAVYGYEAGRKQPSVASLVALADFFEVSTDCLLGRC